MKKNILYMAALAPLAFASCLSDEGNYDYTELQEVEITGLGDNIRCVLLEQQDITPTVTTTLPDSRLEYVWRVGADTLARQKTLDYTFKKVPGSNAPLTFEVIDKQTRVRYTKNIALTVVSPFTTGYAVLTDAGKLAVCTELAKYLAGEEVQLARYNEVGWGPSNLAAQQNEAVQADEALSALAAQLNFCIPQGQYPGDYWPLATSLGDSILAGEYDNADDAALMAVLQQFQDICIGYAK